MSKTELSRRQFIGTALCSGAAVGLAGCLMPGSAKAFADEKAEGENADVTPEQEAASADNEPNFMKAPEPVAQNAITRTVDADVVVVGCGIAGMAAAKAASEEGAKVVVIEKSPSFNTRGSMGCAIGSVDNKYQREANYATFDKAEMINRFMQDTLQMADQRLIAHWANHSSEDIEWFLGACDGYDIALANDELPETREENHVYVLAKMGQAPEGRYPEYPTAISINFDMGDIETSGFYYPMKAFEADIEANGGEFIYSTWGRQLVKDGDRVVAVVAEDIDGNYIQVNATKGVVLSCGDISGNSEMMQYYAPSSMSLFAMMGYSDAKGNPCNLGEGHQMALWAGAVMEDGPFAPMSHTSATGELLLLTKTGRRFINEDLGAQSASNAIQRCPGGIAYCVTGGAQGPRKKMGPGGGEEQPSYDTLEAVAEAMGCDSAVLTQTIERYNELAAAGVDEDFGKSSSLLIPIEAPYYLSEMSVGSMLVMLGGIDCDEKCRALDAEGDPVAGLYVAGNNQGRRFGAEYPMTCPGISHGIALSLGRLAGKTAATEA